MASTTETGHINNLANFKTMISYCTGYGADYNPSAEHIKLDNLKLQHKAADEAHAICLKKSAIREKAKYTRSTIFETLVPKAGRVMNAIIASGAEEKTIKSARTLMRKLWGKRAGKMEESTDPTQPVTEMNSTSQRGIDQMIEHYTALLEIIQIIPEYQPNETELQTTNLLAFKTELIDADNLVKQCDTDWENCRIVRYDFMYVLKTGFAATAKLVKSYVKSVYGASSAQYKQLSALQFTRPAK